VLGAVGVLLGLLFGVIAGYDSTMLAGVAILFAAMAWGEPATRVAYAAVIALFLLYTHRANLARLRQGREPRFERARVLGRLMDRGR
jgi:glycerol-3-phosphate acyltransferase PlsY